MAILDLALPTGYTRVPSNNSESGEQVHQPSFVCRQASLLSIGGDNESFGGVCSVGVSAI